MNPRVVQATAFVMILAVGVSYFIFLYSSYQQWQKDRETRDAKIDQLLERIPVPKPPTADASE
jgi:predicted RND superfamily exporter protein